MNERKKGFIKKAGIAVLIIILLYLFLHRKDSGIKPMPPPSVTVQKPEVLNLAEYITQTGTTVAFNSVDLVARVEGYLNEVQFVDGSFVKKGDPLFIIEPEPYMDKVKEAKASVIAQKADLAYSKTEYARQQRMYRENATSQNNVEKWLAKSEASAAELDKAEANADVASINYGYTHVLAPFDGRIGRHLVDPGNLVGNGKATTLATIEQIDPIYVYFNLNELDLIRVRAAARKEGIKPEDINTIPVYVGMQNEVGFPHEGKLNFVNTGLNASTGTMEFRALLSNKDYPLLPGLFVQVRIAVSQSLPRLTVPDTAILYDQIGPYVLTMDKNHIVQLKRVTTGSVENGKRIIHKGISADENVIIDGLQFATPGNPVTSQGQGKA